MLSELTSSEAPSKESTHGQSLQRGGRHKGLAVVNHVHRGPASKRPGTNGDSAESRTVKISSTSSPAPSVRNQRPEPDSKTVVVRQCTGEAAADPSLLGGAAAVKGQAKVTSTCAQAGGKHKELAVVNHVQRASASKRPRTSGDSAESCTVKKSSTSSPAPSVRNQRPEPDSKTVVVRQCTGEAAADPSLLGGAAAVKGQAKVTSVKINRSLLGL